MRRNIDSQWALDKQGLKVRGALILAAALILWSDLSNPAVLGAVGLLGLLNVAGWYGVSSLTHYIRFGQRLIGWARGLDVAISVAAAFWGPLQGQNVWLFAVPAIVGESIVTRSRSRAGFLAGLGSALALGAIFTGANIGGPITVALTLAMAGIAGIVLGVFQLRDEQLSMRDGRLETVLECSANLAGSTDLRSMMLQTLKAAVTELQAACGYIMLYDDEDPDRLVTEVAYSTDGEFEFPERLGVGQGLTGYAVKMGQPIALHDATESDFSLEGVRYRARSAVSIPLVARNFMGAGQASVERTVGALTLLSGAAQGFSKNEDMQVLQSIGSMIAVAVANSQMELRQRTTFLKTLESLAKSLEARDTYTQGHSQRVSDLSMLIGERVGLSLEALEELRVGTILHDIGKIGVPDQILNKPGRLTDEEFEVMKSHPVIGYEICRPLMLSEGVLMIIRNHHEKLDGSGYPDGLKGGELPLSLRIVCVADAFDAMSSRRPYRDVMDLHKVLGELAKGAGTQFDSVVVEALKELLPTERMAEIYRDQWDVPVTEAKIA
ncbi:MAG TPA: HD domain-containing protein [Fimbriimonadaceae bacterium]|nr:HD domain-containing protein [Fimbriimonadaceae bacterium]